MSEVDVTSFINAGTKESRQNVIAVRRNDESCDR